MNKMQEIKLEDGAGDYIASRMAHSSTLFKLVLSKMQPSHGTVSTYLPFEMNVGMDRLHQFTHAIRPLPPFTDATRHFDAAGNPIHIIPVETLDSLLVIVLQDYLDNHEGSLCVFDAGTPLSEASGFGHTEDARLLVHDREGHFVLSSEDAGRPEHILETIEIASFPWQLVGVLTSTRDQKQFPKDQTVLSENDIQVLAANATAIVVNAYDSE